MANNIALAERYLAVLDEKYTSVSRTARLDGSNGDITFIDNNIAKIYALDLPGFGNYGEAGYPIAPVTGGWEKFELKQHRGVCFEIDRFDNSEAFDIPAGRSIDVFTRRRYVPEIDAYRFMKYAAGASASNVTSADITVGTTDVPGLIDTAFAAMQKEDSYREDSLIYVSADCYAGLKAKITRMLANETSVNRMVETYDGHEIVWVPDDRFNTLITLYDGEENFGYAVTAGGYKINFMIVNPDAVLNAKNWYQPKIFSPDEYQKKDSWAIQLRLYHDAFVLPEKADGIYVHKASTANS